jgi:hypothetical protein
MSKLVARKEIRSRRESERNHPGRLRGTLRKVLLGHSGLRNAFLWSLSTAEESFLEAWVYREGLSPRPTKPCRRVPLLTPSSAQTLPWL